ncbi:MAG: dephospho-CoA kinase [Clostridia bacterium]|nr:dephospho-CoA kinase [Clostridia bacterium]
MIIGLTGGSGTGKSTAANIIKEYGFICIDFDKVSREVTSAGSDCLNEIVSTFGKNILNSDGSLDRRLLGSIVFTDNKKLDILTKITHKHILIETEKILKDNEGKNLLLDAPLLFEAGLQNKCDYVISVLADEEIRIRRITERDNISENYAKSRIASQHDDDFYTSQSDFCVYNNSTSDELKTKIDVILRSIMND